MSKGDVEILKSFSYKLDFSIEDGGHVTLSYHSENENMLTPFMFPNHSVIQEQNFRTIDTCRCSSSHKGKWVKKLKLGKVFFAIERLQGVLLPAFL